MTSSPPGVLIESSPPDAAAIGHPLLSALERARCARFRHEIDAARHATGRVLAREAAARLLGVTAARLGIVPDTDPATRGCPRLTLDGALVRDTHLTIAHAGEVVLVAVSPQPCGIDVEVVAAVEPVVGSDTIYSAGEIAALERAGAADRLPLAARWWTAKEAVLKALEVGLGIDPPLIDVQLDLVTVAASGPVIEPGPGGAPLAGRPTTWRLHDVAVPAGHVATLATPA